MQDVWSEIKRRYNAGENIDGRVLNACNGGFAIGIGGYVAFAPLSGCPPWVARKIGVLQPFYIKNLKDGEMKNIVVISADTRFSGGSRGSPFVGSNHFQQKRRPAPVPRARS